MIIKEAEELDLGVIYCLRAIVYYNAQHFWVEVRDPAPKGEVLPGWYHHNGLDEDGCFTKIQTPFGFPANQVKALIYRKEKN